MTTNNRFAILRDLIDDEAGTQVKKQVKKKAQPTAPQQQPPPQQPPQQNPLATHRAGLLAAARLKLTDVGFIPRTNTYIYTLVATVTHDGLIDMPVHLTINDADLTLAAGQATINNTARNVLRNTKYHVTFEEFDNYSDTRNPRWYSQGQQHWSTAQSGFDPDISTVPSAQVALDEADDIITNQVRA